MPAEEIVELSDAFSGGMTHIVRGGLRQAKPLALSPDNMFIAVARQTSIEIRELCHENVIDSSVPLYQPGEQIEFSSDGRLPASAGQERLDLWDAATGRDIHTWETLSVF